ncbi:MAG: exodeoxyribonuclease III [Alphaproteobacteria bacterium]
MKLATWNVNSLRTRLPHVLRWWDATQPDVLLLQETKVEDALFPRTALEERGLHLAIHGQKSYNGVAIVSKHPITDVVHGFNGQIFNDHARVITATTGGLRVMSVYVPQGESVDSPKFAFKQQFAQRLTAKLAGQLALHPKLVVGGDFNVAMTELDVDDPAKRAGHCMFTLDERAWLGSLINLGLHDALRLVDATGKVFSWWDYRDLAFVKNRGLRIDYLFVSAALKAKVSDVTHFKDERTQPQPSDHVPVMVEITV